MARGTIGVNVRNRVNRPSVRALAIVVAVAIVPVVAAVSAQAGTQPVVTRLSSHHGVYWGGGQLTVFGRNFTGASAVLFGRVYAHDLDVLSSTKLVVREPSSALGTYAVRVVTPTGRSAKVRADRFTYRYPGMNTPIQGGLTARQEIRISARVRAAHHDVRSAPRSRRWTAAMGRTAVRRAHSWLGVPYSWDGGDGDGPTRGVCEHNGGDLDCHVVGFDCSGLALYSWWPYEHLPHYAAYQHAVAGGFHPTIGELVPGDLVFFGGDGISHVAIYTGHGMVIQAPESGSVVMRSRLADVIAGDPYRGATRPMSTGRQGRAPRVLSVTTQLPVSGGTVTISGQRLDETTAVKIGGEMIYHFVRRTPTRLVVTAPPHHGGRVRVAVSDAWGTATAPLTYVGAPHFSTLSPFRGPSEGGTTVTITGTNLADVRTLRLGTESVPFTVLGDRKLELTMPAHASGPVTLTATSPFGTSNQKRFWYLVPAPTPTPTPTSPTPTPTPTSSTPSATATAPAGKPTTAKPPTPTTTAPARPSSTSSSASRPSTTSAPAPTTTGPTTPAPSSSTAADAGTASAPARP